MDGKEVLLLQSLFWPSVLQRNYLQVSQKLASLLLSRPESGWAQPPVLTRSFLCDSLLQRGVGPKRSEAAENYPIMWQPIKAFFFFFFYKILYLLSPHGSVLRTGSVGFMKLFWDSGADNRPHFDVSGKWMFQGSVFSNPTSVLPSHHCETGRLSQNPTASALGPGSRTPSSKGNSGLPFLTLSWCSCSG